MATVHIIGAGVAGLAAATQLAARGVAVKVYEALQAAGGRARSGRDAKLGNIDAGLHLMRKSDAQLWQLLKRIQAEDAWERLPHPYRFMDHKSHKRWSISPWRALPRAPLGDIAPLVAGIIAQPDKKLSELLPADSPLYAEWVRPVSRLLLAEQPEVATARALRQQFGRMLTKGAALYVSKNSLNESLIAPALFHLEYHGGSIYFGQALKKMERDEQRVHMLGFAKRQLPLMEDEAVIFALPAKATQSFFPEIAYIPSTHSAITLHYHTTHRETVSVRFITSGPFDVVRYQENRISVTLRIADGAWHSDQKLLAERWWRAVQKLHPYLKDVTLPPYALWREKQAGHAWGASKINITLPHNCFLAGDWLDASKPSSLETAAQSGHEAAEAALAWMGQFPRRTQQHFYLN